MNESPFINTLLQRGVRTTSGCQNRFNGFLHGVETVETVSVHLHAQNTSLKQGVNETCDVTMQHFNDVTIFQKA